MNFEDISITINVHDQIAEPGSKLSYAYKKNRKAFDRLKEVDGGYNEKSEDKRLELAAVGDKNEVLYNAQGGFIFTKENTKELTKSIKSLLKTTEADFVFFQTTYSALTEGECNKLRNIDDFEYEIISRFISELPKPE